MVKKMDMVNSSGQMVPPMKETFQITIFTEKEFMYGQTIDVIMEIG